MNFTRQLPLALLSLFGSGSVLAAPQVAPGLPLRNVVLFSTGVGYFGRSGPINGDAQVDLQFRAPQVSDILKSLVIRDPGGPVQPVTYSIADWMRARPQPADIQVASDGTPGSVLRTFQGATLRVERPSGAVEGRLVSVSTLRVKFGDSWNDVEVASLLTDAGLQVVRLDDATAIRLTDPALDARFRASLEHLAAGFTAATDDGLRTLSLHYHGPGPRTVSAGYLQETPSWKTTYRLILDKSGKSFLQGWAIVENPTDEDWDHVNLTMVSGQPVSFIQDLYAPIYVSRPTVAPLIIGSSQPQTYGEGYGNTPASNDQPVVAAAVISHDGGGNYIGSKPTDLYDMARITALENKVTAPPRMTVSLGVLSRSGDANYIDRIHGTDPLFASAIEAGGLPAASGAQRGELFAYAIDSPITLHRGDAAMIPIVDAPVQGEPVSVVTSGASAGELNPANGFLLTNTSGSHLQGGPITVYSGGIYAGDALTSDVSPGETRLISYASDLDLNGRLDHVDDTSKVTKISALAGVLTVTTEEIKTGNFVFRNKSSHAKTLVLQYPSDPDWTLENPKASYEKSENLLRFRLTMGAGQTLNYALPLLRDASRTFIIGDADAAHLISYLHLSGLSAELKAKLAGVQTRREALADTQARQALNEKALAAIVDDQARIRGNMGELSQDGALYKEYVAKLQAQETQVENLHEQIDREMDQEDSMGKDLRAYVEALNG